MFCPANRGKWGLPDRLERTRTHDPSVFPVDHIRLLETTETRIFSPGLRSPRVTVDMGGPSQNADSCRRDIAAKDRICFSEEFDELSTRDWMERDG